jgi:hypothetical protein
MQVRPLLQVLDPPGGDEREADPFARWHRYRRGTGDGERGRRLLPADWWPVVDAVIPTLAHFWARRPLAASFGERPEEAEEWPGLTDLAAGRGDHEGGAGDHHDEDEFAPHGEAHGQVPAGGAATLVLRAAPAARPEELGRWLGDAEDFLALVLARELNWLRRGCWSIVGVVVASLLSLTLAVVSYPFQPRGRFLTALGLLAAVSAAVAIAIALRSSRDEVVSRLTGTTPNRLTFDREFVMRLVTSALPLLGLLGALSYGLSDLIRSWFEPLFR